MSITSTRLRSLRVNRGVSQADVANRIGVTRTAYVKYESGVSKPVRKLQEIADYFNVSTDYLLGREKPNMPKEENNLLKGYESLTAEGKSVLLNVLDGLKLTHSAAQK